MFQFACFFFIPFLFVFVFSLDECNTGKPACWKKIFADGSTSKNGKYPTSPGISQYDVSEYYPGSRSFHSLISNDDGFFLFGGIGFDSSQSAVCLLNDVWFFDILTGKWAWLFGNTTCVLDGKYEGYGVYPGGTACHVSFLTETELHIFGGTKKVNVFGNYDAINQHFAFDLNSLTWRLINGTDSTLNVANWGVPSVFPGSRKLATGFQTEYAFYMFGGFQMAGGRDWMVNDLWKYSFNDGSDDWYYLGGGGDDTGFIVDECDASCGEYYTAYNSIQGNNFHPKSWPSARAAATGWVLGENLYLFGGSALQSESAYELEFGLSSDLWCFNTISNLWRYVGGPTGLQSGNFTDENAYPSSRRSALGWTNYNYLYLYGGNGVDMNGDGDEGGLDVTGSLNDIFRYDISQNEWEFFDIRQDDDASLGDGEDEDIRVKDSFGRLNDVTDTVVYGQYPGARYGSSGIQVGRDFYLFSGGMNLITPHWDLWYLEVDVMCFGIPHSSQYACGGEDYGICEGVDTCRCIDSERVGPSCTALYSSDYDARDSNVEDEEDEADPVFVPVIFLILDIFVFVIATGVVVLGVVFVILELGIPKFLLKKGLEVFNEKVLKKEKQKPVDPEEGMTKEEIRKRKLRIKRVSFVGNKRRTVRMRRKRRSKDIMEQEEETGKDNRRNKKEKRKKKQQTQKKNDKEEEDFGVARLSFI